jgi:VWFA-related protein
MRRLLPFLLLLAPAALAQNTFQEKVTVTYVEVPVTVLARDNAPVRGLTKENFEIVDDGQKRAIESFDTIDFAAEGAQKAISPLNPASRRNFLLLFDLSFSSPSSLGRAQDAARNFIARSLGRRDLVAIASVDVDRGFRFLTAFTTDRELLHAAIKDPRNFKAFDPLQIAMTQVINPIGGSSGIGPGVGDKRGVAEELIADLQRNVTRMDDAYRRSRIKHQVEMLALVAHQLSKLVGRKHIVLLSEGFDPRLVQGRLAAETKEQTEENTFVIDGEVWKVDSDKRFGNAGAQQAISAMADEFRKSDVVLHALDIQGVRVQNDVQGGARVNSNEGLFLLANSTGGTVFRNSNNITSDFDRLARQHEVVYVLGFQAPASRAGEFHELKVKLVNVPGARVQHRGGYYGAGRESAVERTLSTAEVIVNDIAQDDIDVAAMATPFLTSSEKAQVPVILEISGADLLKNARNNIATTEVFVYAFDEDGLVRDSMFQRLKLDMTKVGDKLRDGAGIKFYATLSLPPGSYAVKNLVRVAETDKKGYQRVDVTVPGVNDVAVLKPMFFEEGAQWVMVKGGSNDKTNAPYPFVLNGESFVPAARASLRKGEPRLFTLWVYNANREELTWEIAPEAKLVSESKPDGSDVTKLLFSLERVPANTRALDVTVRKKGSTDERRVSVPLREQ